MTEPINLYYYIVSLFPSDEIPERVIEWKSVQGYVVATNDKRAEEYIRNRFLHNGTDSSCKKIIIRTIRKVYLTNGMFL